MIVKNARGFTLVELMIVVVVIGVLAAISIPSYQNYMKKSKRVEVQAYLMELGNTAANYKLINKNFSGITLAQLGNAQFPATSPNYNISLETVSNSQGAILELIFVASPIATTAQKGTGVITLTSKGDQCWYKDTDTVNLTARLDNEGNLIPATACTNKWTD